METRRFREATIQFDGITKDIQRYSANQNPDENLQKLSLASQLSLLYPFAPRIANELSRAKFGQPVLTWPEYSKNLEFPEEHDSVEHSYMGKKYIDFILGAIRRSMGVAKGRGIYDESRAQAVFPSNYSLKTLSQTTDLLRMLGKCNTIVEEGTRVPYLRQDGINF